MSVSSYGAGTTSTGKINVKKDLNENIENRHVIIVEDIIDSGNTLFNLKNLLLTRNPASLKIITLLDKPDRRTAPINADYCGFVIPDEFVIGYGLDFDEKYRELPEVCILKRSEYEK
jgi:hypoxanthine phosphoribosyltransferase